MWRLLILVVILVAYPKLIWNAEKAEWSDVHYRPYGWIPMHELRHDPAKATYAPDSEINNSGYYIPGYMQSPDYRIPEPPFAAIDHNYQESNRPYRLNPFRHVVSKFNAVRKREWVYQLGCVVCITFKRHIPVATGALLTSRHVLTSATAIEMVLQKYGHKLTLENILGFWYEASTYFRYNTSFYASIARIHYHPRYNWPDRVNRSHPLPCIFDLAILATTYNVLGSDSYESDKAVFCQRAASSSQYYTSTTLRWNDLFQIVGFQFMWAYNKVPSPFHKYLIRSREGELNPCPKIEWGWYHCIERREWGKLGFDLGGAYFLSNEENDLRYSGLIGINALSMKLRSMQVVHYFTVLDRYCVLDWLYAAFMGRQKYRWLDHRFRDTQFNAPRLKPWLWIPIQYPVGVEHSYSGITPWAK